MGRVIGKWEHIQGRVVVEESVEKEKDLDSNSGSATYLAKFTLFI